MVQTNHLQREYMLLFSLGSKFWDCLLSCWPVHFFIFEQKHGYRKHRQSYNIWCLLYMYQINQPQADTHLCTLMHHKICRSFCLRPCLVTAMYIYTQCIHKIKSAFKGNTYIIVILKTSLNTKQMNFRRFK